MTEFRQPTGSDPHGEADALSQMAAALREAREALELERMKSETFAQMSHEMRTLLAGIIGITALLLETPLSAEQRDYAKRVRTSGDALLAIINDTLDFAKLDRGRIELDVAELDVRKCVEEVGDLLAERAHTKGLELTTFVHRDTPPLVRGDSVRLKQILLNFVSNAIKFTDKGEVILSARPVESSDEARAAIRFEVVDTGVGISEAGQRRLFEPFAQVDASAKRFGGTGLGLAIAKRLIQAMDGQMGVVSDLGKGSTFYCEVSFPKVPADPSANRGPLLRIDLDGRRVLVAASNESTRSSIREMIASLSIDATLVADGGQALAACEAASKEGRPFEMAFADAKLPDMSGLDLAGSLADLAGGESPKVVLMTPVAHRPSAAQTPENVAAFLSKPIRQGQLTAVLLQVLGGLEMARDSVRRPRDVDPASSRVVLGTERPKILVVEDNTVNQKVAAFMVEKRGYATDLARDGLEAVQMAHKTPYAAILMDCHMPRFDGFQATRQIRQLEGAERHTPIIAMTADAREEAREQCIESGMDDYLSKPLINEQLDQTLKRWCGEAPASAVKGRARATRRSASDIPPAPSSQPSSGLAARKREAAPDELPALDPRSLEKLRAVQSPSDPDLVEEVIELFLQEVPRRVGALGAAVRSGSARELREVAHALKGSAGQLGARGVQAVASRLEELGRSGFVEGAAPLLDDLERELQRAQLAMRQEQNRRRR